MILAECSFGGRIFGYDDSNRIYSSLPDGTDRKEIPTIAEINKTSGLATAEAIETAIRIPHILGMEVIGSSLYFYVGNALFRTDEYNIVFDSPDAKPRCVYGKELVRLKAPRDSDKAFFDIIARG